MGEKISQYTNSVSASPNLSSLLDLSEFDGTNYDSSKWTLTDFLTWLGNNFPVQEKFTFYNNTGSTITKGTPCIINSQTGGVANAEPYTYLGFNDTSQIFIANEDILNASSGVFVQKGLLTGIDTSTFTAGDRLYYDYNTAQIVNVKTVTVLFIGICITSAVSGSIIYAPKVDEGTPFYLYGTTTDAGRDKSSIIERSGRIAVRLDTSNYLLLDTNQVTLTSSNQAGSALLLGSNIATNSPSRSMTRFRGTPASPSYTQSGDIIARDNHVSSNSLCFTIQTEATENHSATNAGSKTIIKTIKNGSNTPEDRIEFTSLGTVKVHHQEPNVQSVVSSATVTPNADTDDEVVITAQAVGLTIANPTGTPVQGQALMIRIKDNAIAQTIAFGTSYRAIGVTLPTTTVASKTLYLGCIYNATDSTWDVLGINQEA